MILAGNDFDAAKDSARAYAEEKMGCLFIEDGHDPRISEGAGTIAPEHAQLKPRTILVPVGNGALITGVGCWVKAHSPKTKIVGVCAAGAPSMAESWRQGKPIPSNEARTIADGVAVRVPVLSAVNWMQDFVDDMVLVDDQQIREALEVLRDTLGLILEPSGVLGIAAALNHEFDEGLLATILTGSNFSPDLLAELTRSA